MNPLRILLRWYFSKRALPYWCVLLADAVILFVTGLVVYWGFNRTGVLVMHRFGVLCTLLMYVMLSFIGARIFRTYAGILRYSSFIDLVHVAYANAISLALALVVAQVMKYFGIEELCALTKVQTTITFVIATALMWAMRVLIKALFDVSASDNRTERVFIYGALSGGIGLAKFIQSQRPRRFILQGFISHEKQAEHILLMGRRVYQADEHLVDVIKKRHVDAILVSPLRVEEFRNNQEIQNLLIGAGCKIYMTQQAREASIKDGQLTDEDYQGMQLKEVSVEDLLPRSEIKVDMDSVGAQLRGKRILITGSAGSIGSEMVRQIARYQPASMMLIDQAETPEHDIRLMMAKDFPDVEANTVVTTICDKQRMDHIFNEFRPDYVFHAAAYKHVPMMEDNPSEAVHNNIYGTKVIADLSVKYGVSKFVMVSTDKAVNPTNVMGCSKRICEIYCQSLNNANVNVNANVNANNAPLGPQGRLPEQERSTLNAQPSKTEFITTRFGNVLGSNGSVIPLFREQIKNGGPVTVTDERIVRFFMLIPEACKLVLEAGTKGNGGEIFVFDMGQPVKIADLAKRMIQLSGAKNVEIKYTGLRAGEKLYEEVLSELEGTKPSFHEKIRIAEVRQYDYAEVSKEIDDLINIARQYDDMATVRKMKQIVPEFKSNNSVYEQLDA